MTEVETAQKVVADLTSKREEIEARRAMLEHERDELAYDAHTGDEKAKTKLSKACDALIRLDQDQASIDAAIRTAEQRVREAQGEQRAEIEREQARHAQKLGRQLLDAAKAADCALNQVSAALGDMRNIAAELARLGYQPGVALFEANIRRALLSVPMVGGSFKLDRLPPNQRVTVLELGQNWAAGVEHRASQKLGDPVKEKEVA